jgi:hypothetical protein
MQLWKQDTELQYRLDTGALLLVVEDRQAHGCAWCWLPKGDGLHCGVHTGWLGGGAQTASVAMRYAEQWARRYCDRTLVALRPIGPAAGEHVEDTVEGTCGVSKQVAMAWTKFRRARIYGSGEVAA